MRNLEEVESTAARVVDSTGGLSADWCTRVSGGGWLAHFTAAPADPAVLLCGGSR